MSSPRHRMKVFIRARLHLLLLLLPLTAVDGSLVFTALPAWQSIKTLLLSRKSHTNTRLQLQQWLSYWVLLAGVKALEKTRMEFTLERVSDILKSLPSLLLARLSLSLPSSASSAPQSRPRKQTLAVKLAGSPTRWLIFKSILLFFAMDTEIQGANWLLHKVAKPLVAFFTSIEEEKEMPEDEEQELREGSRMKRGRRRNEHAAYTVEEEERRATMEEQEEYLRTTPELILDGTDSSSSTSTSTSSTDLSNGGSGDDASLNYQATHIVALGDSRKVVHEPAWVTNHWTA